MDDFLTKKNCDRCSGDLKVRTMSWFTEETICMVCAEKETEIKQALRAAGKDTLEGCGYVPKLAEVA